MTWTEITSYNLSKGGEVFLCYVNDISIGLFMNLFLFAVFVIMAVGSYMVQKRQTGIGDLPTSMTLASFTTLVTAILLRLIDCGTNPLTSNIALALSFVMLIISVAWLVFSQE